MNKIKLQVLLGHEAGPHLEYHELLTMPMREDSFYLDNPDRTFVKVIRRVIYENSIAVIVYSPKSEPIEY